MGKGIGSGIWRRNGLSLTYLGLFLASFFAQSLAGWHTHNKEEAEHSQAQLSYAAYLGNPHFWQSVGENWESEFLQMGTYVFFTVFLFQKGSSESKDPDGESEEVDEEPDLAHPPEDAPWPVHAGGLAYAAYKYSLSLAFLLLFVLSLALHALAGLGNFNAEAQAHGQPPSTLWGYLGSSEFWFESMQNWQSEFLAVFSMVFLSIYLRQKGSPESKPIAAPHAKTGK